MTIAAAVVVVLSLLIIVIGAIGIFRLFDVDVFGNRTWASFFLIGGIFCGAGALLVVLAVRAQRRGSGV